jgi:hypothetical protein
LTDTLYISATPHCICVLQTQLMLHFVPFMPMPFLTRVSGLGKQNKERESCVSIGKKNKTKKKISHGPYANPISHKNLMLCLLGPD